MRGRCLTRGFIAVVSLGMLGWVTSAAAQRPGGAILGEPGSAQAVGARPASPMEADMMAIAATDAAPAPPQPPAVAAAPAPPPPPLSRGAQAVETALTELGKPYRYGALGPRTFDCSGLTKFAYSTAGIVLPHSAAAQYWSGPRVDRGQLQPGDLIFWRGLGHVGMYVGGGRMIHAPETGDVVRIASIDQADFLGAVRPGG